MTHGDTFLGVTDIRARAIPVTPQNASSRVTCHPMCHAKGLSRHTDRRLEQKVDG